MFTMLRSVPPLAGIFGKRLELCCPAGVPNEAVARLRREGLHFGRLR